MKDTNLEKEMITETDETPIKQFRSTTTKKKQKIFIKIFIKNNALVQLSCEEAKITRETYYRWINDYPEFKKAIDDAVEHKLDLLENRLNKLIEKGDTQATIFATKCLLKHRGYKEKQEVEVSGNVNVNILNVDPISNNN